MNRTLTNLTRVMSELEVGESVNTPDERATVQKAVHLVQAIGVNLGYQYSGHTMEPYCQDLSKDFRSVHEHPTGARQEIAQRELREPFASALKSVKDAMRIPQEVKLTRTQWIELLASVHHLLRLCKLDEPSMERKLAREKPILSPYVTLAAQSLASHGLMDQQS